MLHQIITVHVYKEKKDWDDNPLWQITYLLTEWEDQMGKYLAWGHEVASVARSVQHDWEPNISLSSPNKLSQWAVYHMTMKCWKFGKFCFNL